MDPSADPRRDRWTCFVVLWATSVAFHLAGNPRLLPVPWRLGLGAAVVLALARPSRVPAVVPLALVVPIAVALETPALGNHWLLSGFVAVVVLAAIGEAARRRRSVPAAGDLAELAFGPLRVVLLCAYGFAAFAKLNRDFFDPVVSCATFYLRESAASWGALGTVDALPESVLDVVPLAVAVIELSVPVLLAVRRTRLVGVCVAIGFHFVLALDRSHQFFDFSSVLTALFILFLPPSTWDAAIGVARRARDWLASRRTSGPELVHLFALAWAASVPVVAALPDREVVRGLRAFGVWSWIALGGTLLVTLRWAVRAGEGSAVGRGDREATTPPARSAALWGAGVPRWLAAVPLVVVVNGLTPYVEAKSAFGWNMYANLAVVDGDSNHLVIRNPPTLGRAHDRVVRIEETNDPSLLVYRAGGWGLAEVQLLDYLATAGPAPDGAPVVLSGTLADGRTVRYEASAVRSTGLARSTLAQRVAVFRAVDVDGPVNCQPVFGPAR